MNSTRNFSYEFRLSHPDSPESHLCVDLLGRLTEQTMLVEKLFTDGLFDYEDIEHRLTNTDDQDDDPQEIFQWAYFPASEYEIKRLEASDIPYLNNDYGIWIGITSFGTSWEIYVAEQLANALYC